MTKSAIAIVVFAAALANCDNSSANSGCSGAREDGTGTREQQPGVGQQPGTQQNPGTQQQGANQNTIDQNQADLARSVQSEINEVEQRFQQLDQRAQTALTKLDATTGVGAEIQQERMLAKAKLEAARTSTRPEETQAALRDAKRALDQLEQKLGQQQPGQQQPGQQQPGQQPGTNQ